MCLTTASPKQCQKDPSRPSNRACSSMRPATVASQEVSKDVHKPALLCYVPSVTCKLTKGTHTMMALSHSTHSLPCLATAFCCRLVLPSSPTRHQFSESAAQCMSCAAILVMFPQQTIISIHAAAKLCLLPEETLDHIRDQCCLLAALASYTRRWQTSTTCAPHTRMSAYMLQGSRCSNGRSPVSAPHVLGLPQLGLVLLKLQAEGAAAGQPSSR